MSRIEELIAIHCPLGVEFKELGELCENIFSGKNKDKLPLGKYPVYGSTGIIGYTDTYSYETDLLLIARVGANAGYVHRAHGKYDVSDNTLIVKTKENYNISFAYYQLTFIEINNLAKGGGQPLVTAGTIKKIQIPIPPLPIQLEIVSILDKFTSLEAELKAELEARKKQYEYYRNELFNFDGKEVERKALGEIGEFTRGKRFVKTDIVNTGVPCIHYGELYTHYKIWANEAKSFLQPDLANKLRFAKHGDVVIVAAGETIEDIGNGVAWLGKEDVVIHDACFSYSHKMNPKYVSYFFQTPLFRSQIKRNISSGKISAINALGLSKAKIPVPSMAEQDRVADILDNFNALLNDTSVGLPAEIDGRLKQYEYYRGKLLTFKSLNSN